MKDGTALSVVDPETDPDTEIETVPKGKSGLGLRVVSAFIMIPPVLAAVYFGYPWFDLLMAIAAILMMWEWRGLCDGPQNGMIAGQVGLVAAVAAMGLGYEDLALPLVLGFAFLAALLSKGAGGNGWKWMALGVVYLGLPLIAFVWIRHDETRGLNMVFWLFLIVWATDTGAYVAGRLIGGFKLAPKISPNKTWAGLIGGMIAAGVAGIIVAAWVAVTPEMSRVVEAEFEWIILTSALVGGFSQLGDLFESGIKRFFDVKDSSGLIPGHGGILDRVDGLLAAVLATMGIILVMGNGVFQWM